MQTEFYQECRQDGIHPDACISQNFMREMRQAGYSQEHYTSIHDLPTWALQGQHYPAIASIRATQEPASGLPLWLIGVLILGGLLAAAKGGFSGRN